MRISVIGTSGAGKTTFARRLAEAVGAPYVELDAINWQPGWRDLATHDPAEFRRRVAEAAAAEAWVSDGNYSGVQDLILARVSIPLDPVTAGRAAVAAIMARQKLSKVALAAKMGKDEKVVRRILDGGGNTSMANVSSALKALGAQAALSVTE